MLRLIGRIGIKRYFNSNPSSNPRIEHHPRIKTDDSTLDPSITTSNHIITTDTTSHHHDIVIDESQPELFQQKWTTFFSKDAYDSFEVCRGLNNCFSYDIVPPVPVLEAALRACRKYDDFATASRIFVGLREKMEKEEHYEEYLKALRPLMDELGVLTPEELGREMLVDN